MVGAVLPFLAVGVADSIMDREAALTDADPTREPSSGPAT
jgi:hypothetical protein